MSKIKTSYLSVDPVTDPDLVFVSIFQNRIPNTSDDEKD